MGDIVERLRERADAVEADGTGAGLVNAEYFRKSASEIEWLKYIVMRRTEVVNTQANEIERLREALKSIAYDIRSPRQTARRAMEALGDD